MTAVAEREEAAEEGELADSGHDLDTPSRLRRPRSQRLRLRALGAF